MGLFGLLIEGLLESGKVPALNRIFDDKFEEVGRQVKVQKNEIDSKVRDVSTGDLKKMYNKVESSYIKESIEKELDNRR